MAAKFESINKLLKRDSALRVRFDEALGVFRNLRGNLAKVRGRGAKGVRSIGLQFIKAHSDLFGKINSRKWVVLEETSDPQGGISLTLQQFHGSLRVFGGSVRFHANKDGILDVISNRLFPDLDRVPAKPRVSAEKAIKTAQAKTKCFRDTECKPELLVYRYKGKALLAWEIRLNETEVRKQKEVSSWLAGEHGAPPEWIAFVDAISGQVLYYYDNVQTVGAIVGNGTGQYSGVGSVNAWDNGTTFQLRDTTRSAPEVVTNDEDGASPSEDADNNWNDLTTIPRDQNQGAEVDTHRYAGDAVDYFQTVHTRNSIDGLGMNVESVVHFGTNTDNAYWEPSLSVLRIGDGSGVDPGFDYLCTDDVIAHEFTHGVTQFTCGLIYQNESGALNEAFSDIMAAFITLDWWIGELCWLKASAPALRNMIDPTNGGQWDNSSEANAIASVIAGHQPSHYNNRYTGSSDNGGVHINSGIINHLFYLLTVGGTHAISGITVAGIGQSAAEQMLYRCMSVNLVGNPAATFLDFREAMMDACLDLFPADLDKLSQVKNAFNAVGIGPDIYVRDNLLDSGEEPYPGSYLYASPDIINRISPSANPAVDFADLTDDGLWENVEFGQDNHVYVRLQNRGNETGDATVNVYFIAATSFGTPASWIHIGTLVETAIAPGSLRISGPLLFPEALIPAVGHYCMIAVASDVLDPAPDHNLISSVSDYVDFVRNTNNIAYRNMNVVDDLPGFVGTFEAEIRSLSWMRERYDLRIDLSRFVPGAKIRVRGPAYALDGSIARGLKLVARTKGENIYEVLVGQKRIRQKEFFGLKRRDDFGLGFDNVLVEKTFRLAVNYVLPDEGNSRELKRQFRRKKFPLTIRQLWKGEAVGAVTVLLQLGSKIGKQRK